MQVPHHGIAVPSTQHFDQVLVNFATEECHGAAGPKGTCTDFTGSDACDVILEGSSRSENVSDVLGLDWN